MVAPRPVLARRSDGTERLRVRAMWGSKQAVWCVSLAVADTGAANANAATGSIARMPACRMRAELGASSRLAASPLRCVAQ